MSDFYKGKLIYVTGGSSGIGLAMAHKLTAHFLSHAKTVPQPLQNERNAIA